MTGKKIAWWERVITVATAFIPLVGGALARKGIKLSNDGVRKIVQAVADWLKKSDDAADVGKHADDVARGVGKSAEDIIDGIKIVDGKVGGKIPVVDFNAIRNSSVKNPSSDSITLGKYTEGVDSYISKAGKDSSYFDLGSDWGKIQNKYNLSDEEMFEYFNKPALNDAILGGKSIRFSHDPRGTKGFLGSEWSYIKEILNLTDDSLIEIGGMWYVK